MTESSSETDGRIQETVGDLNASISSAEMGVSATFYSTFEERFRGAREDIAKRQSVYLPILEKAGVLQSDAAVLDVGCGRGEWLELLGEHGYKAKGVDFNKKTVLDCQAKGLDIAYAEAVQYLRAQPADGFAAVTSFHLVEHLPFASLMELLAEIHRVLRPGGVMILETPNPENIIVGACNFYFDPTHKAPIPPDLLRFLAEQAGFASSCVAWVNADCFGAPLAYLQREIPSALQINAVIHLLNRSFYIAPDYAIVGQKGGGANSIAGSVEIDLLCRPRPVDTTYFRLLEAEAEAEALRAEAHEASAGIQGAEARIQEAKAQIAAIQNSYSWKVTAPIRAVGRVLNAISHPYAVPDFADIAKSGGANNMVGSVGINRSCKPVSIDTAYFWQLENEIRTKRVAGIGQEVEIVQEFEAKVQEAKAKVQEAKAWIQDAESVAQWAEEQMPTIQNTFSWKVAAPIRAFGRILITVRRPR